MATTAKAMILGRAAMTARVSGMRRRPIRNGCLGVVGSSRNSSFIKQVMEQVKRDMEAEGEKGKEDWKKAQETSAKLKEKADTGGDRLSELGGKMKGVSEKTSEMLGSWKARTEEKMSEATKTMKDKTGVEDSEAFQEMRNMAEKQRETMAAGSTEAMKKSKGVFDSGVDMITGAFGFLDMDNSNERNAKLKQWRESQAVVNEAAKKKREEAEAAAEAEGRKYEEGEEKPKEGWQANDGAQQAQPDDGASAVVVSDRGSSTWDRFGAGLRDMPFLNNVFTNPLFDRMLGPSEIAAAIREMKDIDYYFNLEEFTEDIEYVVAPHIVASYLNGDSEGLERHCGEAAYAAVNASIEARIKQKMSLDPTILAGPKEVELVRARNNDKGPPDFVFTFRTQQINCLWDQDNEIIEGAIDDIRTVTYAMAVQRHPDLESDGLLYPWQVTEIAILYNEQSF